MTYVEDEKIFWVKDQTATIRVLESEEVSINCTYDFFKLIFTYTMVLKWLKTTPYVPPSSSVETSPSLTTEETASSTEESTVSAITITDEPTASSESGETSETAESSTSDITINTSTESTAITFSSSCSTLFASLVLGIGLKLSAC